MSKMLRVLAVLLMVAAVYSGGLFGPDTALAEPMWCSSPDPSGNCPAELECCRNQCTLYPYTGCSRDCWDNYRICNSL